MLRKRRRELGGDQRAEQREHAGSDPDEQHAATAIGTAPVIDRRLHEDRRADDDADDHRGRSR